MAPRVIIFPLFDSENTVTVEVGLALIDKLSSRCRRVADEIFNHADEAARAHQKSLVKILDTPSRKSVSTIYSSGCTIHWKGALVTITVTARLHADERIAAWTAETLQDTLDRLTAPFCPESAEERSTPTNVIDDFLEHPIKVPSPEDDPFGADTTLSLGLHCRDGRKKLEEK